VPEDVLVATAVLVVEPDEEVEAGEPHLVEVVRLERIRVADPLPCRSLFLFSRKTGSAFCRAHRFRGLSSRGSTEPATEKRSAPAITPAVPAEWMCDLRYGPPFAAERPGGMPL